MTLQRIFSAKSKTHDMAAPTHLPDDVCAETEEGTGPQFQVVSAGSESFECREFHTGDDGRKKYHGWRSLVGWVGG